VVKSVEPPPAASAEPEPMDALDTLDRRCADLVAAFADAETMVGGKPSGLRVLRSILSMMQSRLAQVEADILTAQGRGPRLLD